MKTKTLDVSKFFDNVPMKVVIKKLNYGELIDIKDNTPMGIDKLTQVPKELEGQASALFMKATILSVPIVKMDGDKETIVQVSKPTLEEIRSLDFDLGTYLIEEISKFNGLSPN